MTAKVQEVEVEKTEPRRGQETEERKTSAVNGWPPRETSRLGLESWRTRGRASIAAMPCGNEFPFAPSPHSVSPTSRRGSLAALLSENDPGGGSFGSMRHVLFQDQQHPQPPTGREVPGDEPPFTAAISSSQPRKKHGLFWRWFTSAPYVYDDEGQEAKFDEKYWGAAYPSMMGTIAAATVWSFVRLALGFHGNHIGWVEYRVCCSTIYEFYEGVEAQQLSAIMYESIFSGFWLVMLSGFRLENNLLAFLLTTVVPLSVRVRFSENGKIVHLWHRDGSLNIGAFGNFLGWCTAIGVAPIAVSPWLFWADDYAQVRGSGDQLSWLIVVIVIALRLRITQAAALIVPSIVSSWVGIFVYFGRKAREGEESFFFGGRILFLGVQTLLSAFVLHGTHVQERGTRRTFMLLEKDESLRSVLLSVLANILPGRAVERIAECARSDEELQASSEMYEDTAVIFIRENLDEAWTASGHSRSKMPELNRIYGAIDDVVKLHRNVFKVETVGPEYLCSVGVPEECESTACAAVAFAGHVMKEVQKLKWNSGVQVQMRIGIHNGPLTAGISGSVSPQFRLFGDTVNTASRMKSQAAFGEIVISDFTVAKIKECCGQEFEEGRVLCTSTVHGLTALDERMIKGCGVMRVWRVERSGGQDSRSNSLNRSASLCTCGYYLADESTAGSPEASEVNLLRSNLSSDFATTPYANWIAVFRRIREGDLTEMLALENVVHLLPQGSTMSIRSRPLFQFEDPGLETAYRYWYEYSTETSNVFFVGFFIFYVTVVGSAGASLAEFQLEPVASSVEWKIFSIVYYIFISGLPLCLVGAIYLTKKASRSVRQKYMWTTNWMYAFAFMVFVMWAIMPLFYFPSIVDPEASTFGPYNFFERLIYFRAQMVLGNSANLEGVNFQILVPQCFCVALQQIFDTNIGFVLAFTSLYIVLSVGNRVFFKIPTDTTDYVLFFLICMQISIQAVRKRREFRSVVSAARIRVFVAGIIQNILPDHVIKAFVAGDTNSISDESVCGHLFLDIKGYTEISKRLTPHESFEFVANIFGDFDKICKKWGVTKIETLGDAYWCAIGLQGEVTREEMQSLLGMALEINQVLREKSLPCFSIPAIKDKIGSIEARIAIHHGICEAGVVGRSKPRYHLFGDAVDIVQELEQEGDVGGVVVSNSAARAIGLSKIGIVDDKKLFSVWGSINEEMIKDAVITLEDYRVSDKCLAAIRKALEMDRHTSSVAEGASLDDPAYDAGATSSSAFLVRLQRPDRAKGNPSMQDGTTHENGAGPQVSGGGSSV